MQAYSSMVPKHVTEALSIISGMINFSAVFTMLFNAADVFNDALFLKVDSIELCISTVCTEIATLKFINFFGVFLLYI